MEIERATISILAPCSEAAYSSSITATSVSAFSLIRILAFVPAAAAVPAARMRSIRRARRPNGATRIFRKRSGRPNPVR